MLLGDASVCVFVCKIIYMGLYPFGNKLADKRLRKEPKPDVSRYVMVTPALECYNKYFWLTFSKLGENNCGKWPWCAYDHWCFHAHPCQFPSCRASTCNAVTCNAVYSCLAKCSGSHTKAKKVPPWDRMVLLDTIGTFEKHKDMIYARGRAQILFRTRAVLICMKNRYLHHITQIQAYHAHTAAAMLTTMYHLLFCLLRSFFSVSHQWHFLPACHSSHHRNGTTSCESLVLQGLDVQA